MIVKIKVWCNDCPESDDGCGGEMAPGDSNAYGEQLFVCPDCNRVVEVGLGMEASRGE